MSIRRSIITAAVLAFWMTASHEILARPGEEGALQNWTSTNGKSVRARFVSLADSKVTLELESGGRLIEVPLDRLIESSRLQATEEANRRADRSITPLRKMEFVKIPRGRFRMGSPPDEAGRVTNGASNLVEGPDGILRPRPEGQKVPADVETERRVDVSRDFWMKRTEVTWNEWREVRSHGTLQGYLDLGEGRNGFEGDDQGNHPVTCITWHDAVKWCNLKSQIEGLQPVYHSTPVFDGSAVYKTGTETPHADWKANGYRLPTEAEWEYACREGRSTGKKTSYADLDDISWHAGNSGGNTRPVATSKGREHHYGLHDIHGNVAEWCWDWCAVVESQEVEDPRGPTTGKFRVFRGGSWADPPRSCRAAYRGLLSPMPPESPLVGFRPVCGVDPATVKPDQ